VDRVVGICIAPKFWLWGGVLLSLVEKIVTIFLCNIKEKCGLHIQSNCVHAMGSRTILR